MLGRRFDLTPESGAVIAANRVPPKLTLSLALFFCFFCQTSYDECKIVQILLE